MDPIVRAIQLALVEDGHTVMPFDCGDGLYLPSGIKLPNGDYNGIWLRLDENIIMIRTTKTLDVRYDLADPDSIDAILRFVKEHRQQWPCRRDARHRALSS